MTNSKYQFYKQDGAAAIVAVFGIMLIVTLILTSLAAIVLNELKMINNGGTFDNVYYASEAGLNEGLYSLTKDQSPKIFSFNLENVQVKVEIELIENFPYQRLVRSQAISENGSVRTVEAVAETSDYYPSLDYAIVVGDGKIYFENNSMILGNVYSNSDILPGNNGAIGNIFGNVWVAKGATINRANVAKNVYSKNIIKSNIAQNAYYQNIDELSLVGGSICPNENCYPASPEPTEKKFPISDEDVLIWKNEIINGGEGVISENLTACPQDLPGSYYCITSDTVLGEQKISSNLFIGNNAVLTLTGNIWVEGDINLSNNGKIVIDSSLGDASVIIICDGKMEVGNNYLISGSGDPKSYVVLLSTNNSLDYDSPAVYSSNNSDSVIFVALHGLLRAKNNGSINAVVAEGLYIEQNSQVTYNEMLKFLYIPGTNIKPIEIVAGSWKEL